jgi:hypothetical protein
MFIPGGGRGVAGWMAGGRRHRSSGPGGGPDTRNPSVVAVAIFKNSRAVAATELSKSSSLLSVSARGPFCKWPFLHIEQHIRFLCNKNKLRIHIHQTLIFYCIVYKLLWTSCAIFTNGKTHIRQCKMSSSKKIDLWRGLCGTSRCLSVWGPEPHTSPPSTTVYVYTVYVFTQGRGGEWNHREGERGNSSQSWVENTNMTDSINSDKHLP